MSDRTFGFSWCSAREGDALHDAGRTILRSAMSLAIALSLVPTRSMDVLAEELRSLEADEATALGTVPDRPDDEKKKTDADEGGESREGEDVDAEAPTIVGASISGLRPLESDGEEDAQAACDGIRFLSADDQDVVIALVVRDQSGVASVTLHDPRGEYNLEADGCTCGPDEQLEVTLPPIREDVPFRDDIVVTLTDGAGNKRTWSLATTGSIVIGSHAEEAENAELTFGGSGLGHPRALIVDRDDPVVTLSGIPEDARYVQPGSKVRLEVAESNLEALREYDPLRQVASLRWCHLREGGEESEEVISVKDLDENGGATFVLDRDGHYVIDASVTDLAGRRSKGGGTRDVAVDSTPPVLMVSFDQDEGGGSGVMQASYDALRHATVTVIEDNFDERLMEIHATHEGWASAEPEVGAWKHAGDVHTLEVTFDEGEGYCLTVSGCDEAGNLALLKDTDGETLYRSEVFDVDLTAPSIACDYDETCLERATMVGETAYFASELDVTVTLTDRNLDLETLSATVDGEPVDEDAWEVRESEDGVPLLALVVHYAEGAHQTPAVTVSDRAGHEVRLEPRPFVVDLTAPELCSVKTSCEPASRERERPGDDPTLFFDRPTTLSFDVHDLHGIASVRLVDPKGTYAASADEGGFERGDAWAHLSVDLVDGDEYWDASFGRDAYLEVLDVAGNCRIWTLGREGTVVDEIRSSPDNVSLNNEGLHPMALVRDTVAPVITLSGVEEGRYYNSDQMLHVQVDELNLSYLQRFDGSRPILHITSWTGEARRESSTLEVPLALFAGSGSTRSFDYPFDMDGHYVVEAQLVDIANNVSATERIGEFTIDKTPPEISLSWDGEAPHNDAYFNNSRTATVVVKEHTFDPRLIDIETTGAVGAWKSQGDVHTCEVVFGEGGPHSLVVTGRDLAGNAANRVSVPKFVVDTTPPSISFGGVAQRISGQGGSEDVAIEQGGAYNGVVSPAVTLTDDRDLDVESVSLSLRGNKVGEVGESFPHEVVAGRRSWSVAYEDFGRISRDDAPPYDVNVDDVYTLYARVRDLAGNEAEASISFSVNRYGSNYLVTAVEGGREVDLAGNPILESSPTITVREINVSGAGPEGAQHVLKEYANKTSQLERDDGGAGGYSLKSAEHEARHHGWAEYVYTIRSANFGKGSDSDHGDGGQGTYRVNVTSDDRAGNANTTASYWSSDGARSAAVAKVATASFTLDELGPSIDRVDVPSTLAPGSSYEASFHVTDAITRGNDVEVRVDGERVPVLYEGRELAEGELVGEGSFSFSIPARSFAARKVTFKVRDYAQRMDQREVSGLLVTTLVPEAVLVLCMLGVVAFVLRRIVG